jgi:diguanylate cyclase (GGDEF)-like protein/PAS domain S-box-containing protein
MAEHLHEDLARTVLGASNVATAVIGFAGAFQYANAAFERLSGFAAADLAGLRLDSLFAADGAAETERSEAEADRLLRRQDGTTVWVRAIVAPLSAPGTGHHGLILQLIDISDRKAAEAEFERLSRRLELALDASGIGVWEQDLTSGRISWDHRMDEIYRRDPATDLPDFYWERAVHPEDRQVAAFDFTQAVNGRVRYASQFRILLPDGDIRHLRSRAQVFEDADGALKIIGTEWDVSADVLLTEELQRAKALADSRNSELQDIQARLRHAALHDELTDLPNRRYLNQVLAERRLEAETRRKSLALLHIDLDRFKEINDRLGHAAGDVMLRHVADLLRADVREDDFVARIGGDEFVMLCWFDGDAADLSAMAARLIHQVREPVPYEGQVMRAGASIGIACEASEASAPRRLLRDADTALYRAKELGRNRYEFAA